MHQALTRRVDVPSGRVGGPIVKLVGRELPVKSAVETAIGAIALEKAASPRTVYFWHVIDQHLSKVRPTAGGVEPPFNGTSCESVNSAGASRPAGGCKGPVDYSGPSDPHSH